MISIVQNGEQYEIRFPYNEYLVEVIRSVPGRYWHKESKFWTIPKDKLGFLINLIKGTSFESQLNIQSGENLYEQTEVAPPSYSRIPDIDISNVRTYVKEGSTLFKHQKDCLKFSIDRKNNGNFNGFLLADEMGCISGSAIVTVLHHDIVTLLPLQSLYTRYVKHPEDKWYIKSFDERNGIFQFLPIRCVLSKGRKRVLRITLSNNESLICTPDHQILTSSGEWVEAQSLGIGDLVVSCNQDYSNEGRLQFLEVKTIKPLGVQSVYDVGVNDNVTHNFVANGIVVHNCGKTLEVINMALFKKQYESAKHCLIICCVNTAKYNWLEDIKTHTNGEYEGYILGSRYSKQKKAVRYNGSGKQKLEDLETGLMYSDAKGNKPLPFFLITNIESLRMSDRNLKRSERNVFTRKLAELCSAGDISMIAIDEVHRNASPQSRQGSEILKLKTMTGNAVEWIPMTGTPVVNKPTDVFLPMRLVNAHNSNSYYLWNREYCIYGGYGNHNIIGYKNLPKLKSILEPNMLRRTKEQVLDLPKKVYHVEYVENTKYQKRLYDTVRLEMLEDMDEIRKAPNPLVKFLRLRQVNGCPEAVDRDIDTTSLKYPTINAKISRLLELVSDITSNGEKVVIFSNWVDPLRTAYRFLSRKGFNVASYVGTMDSESRELNKEKFLRDVSCNAIVGTIGAMGVSHTLSVASNVIFLDLPWNSATQEQAEDRCHRLNSTKPVHIYQIITKDTVDERVFDIIQQKKGTAEYVVDNSLNFKEHPELVNLLLS